VDEFIYSPENFEGLHETDELARAELVNGSVAVAIRSDGATDEVERQLQKTYGQRLGILVFQNAASDYRVHQLDRKLPATLEQAYERLNLLDPVVTGASENRWAGSTESGGSPRKTGTGLMPAQMIEAIRVAFWKPTFVDVISEIPRAVFLAVAALLPAVGLFFAGNLLHGWGYIAEETVILASIVFAMTAAVLFWFKARHIPGLYGLRAPTNFAWLTMLPAAFIGAAIGGAWAPGSLGYRMGPGSVYEFSAPAALVLALGAELLFRGVVLGDLAARLPIQKRAGQWCGSWPTSIASALYAGASLVLFLGFSNGQLQISQWLLTAAGALIFGVASGVARERSESILSSVLLHWLCAAVVFLSHSFLF